MKNYEKDEIIYLRKPKSPQHWMIVWDKYYEWWSFRQVKNKTLTVVEEHYVCYQDLPVWIRSLCGTKGGWKIDKVMKADG